MDCNETFDDKSCNNTQLSRTQPDLASDNISWNYIPLSGKRSHQPYFIQRYVPVLAIYEHPQPHYLFSLPGRNAYKLQDAYWGNLKNRHNSAGVNVLFLHISSAAWLSDKSQSINYFWVEFYLCVKTSLRTKAFICVSNSTSNEKFCMRFRWKTEANGNLKLACIGKVNQPLFNNECMLYSAINRTNLLCRRKKMKFNRTHAKTYQYNIE